ncbi:hypothetical protein CULT_1500003 [[Clostridium] ultunense Esp]|nr:hypothetical protein CULT_1500003 [[Clostridium] ultunense Esp]
MDDMNPRFFPNSLLIPYLVVVWEEYLKKQIKYKNMDISLY